MRIFLIIMCVVPAIGWTQTKRFIDVYKPERGTFFSLTVPMAYDSDSILARPFGGKLGVVYRVDYAASSFSNSVSDYQKKLDAKRWTKMYQYANMNADTEFEKNIYYQTSADSEEEASKLFHGFVIYFGEAPEKAHTKALGTLPNLVSMISGVNVDEKTQHIDLVKPKFIRTDSVGTISKTKMNEITREYSKDKQIVLWEYDSIGKDKLYYQARYTIKLVSGGVFAAYNALADKSLLEMLMRIKTDKHTLIATDMTGSMYPYYAQLVLWHALRNNPKSQEHYVFFNDGDNLRQADKVIGSTGGIYSTKTNDLITVYKTMTACMQGGGGGDNPENNFEAVQFGIEKFDSISQVILICDNWAVPRDKILLPEIDLPIDFVMCGSTLGVNLEYLRMARQNKGTLHTIEKSMDHLEEKKEGEIFSIGARSYIVRKGEIEEYLAK